jgi:transcriptional regulator with XRE-family HTH domain
MKSIFSGEHREIVGRLKRARIAKGYSQKVLAEKLGSSQSYVSKLEHGQIRLDVVQLKKIPKTLGVNAKEFIK